jgi:CRP-like cAMP-binding protein
MIAGRYDVLLAALLGLATTSSSMIGAALGLHLRLSKRLLASTLAFAAGSLMAALAIELAFKSADNLHHQGFAPRVAWAFVSGGFALGAVIYYTASLALEMRGGAVRYQTRFLEYTRERKQRDTRRMIELLSQCDLLRHLPPEEIEGILPCVSSRELAAGQVLFRAGDPGDALYIVAEGEVAVLGPAPAGKGGDADATLPMIAALRQGQAFGEMALLSGGARTATIRAVTDSILLRIAKEDFERLVAGDPQIAAAVERLSHGRAISNLSVGSGDPATWARMASLSLDHVTRSEASRLLREAGKDSGLAIVFGNILDTIPGCLVIGAKFDGFANLSLTLMLGMFIGGIPEAAASAVMLRKAGYRQNTIFGLWAIVLVAGLIAAAAGRMFIGSSDSLTAIFCQAIAGGAVLALITHAMIPEALHEGGSQIVLPTVAGFLSSLYLSLVQVTG